MGLRTSPAVAAGPVRHQPRSGITRYAENANKSSFLVPDGPVPGIVEWVWAAAKHPTPQELAEMTRLPGSAWDTAFQNGHPFLDDQDIANDLTYREPLLRGARKYGL